MKKLLLLLLLCTFHLLSQGQKNTLYAYWGWNGAHYSKSDLHFKGNDYNFTLFKVKASDRQTKFKLDPYFHPKRLTIPQYNFRIGYFLSDQWDLSFGIDHMKYVMQSDQSVSIEGSISDTSSAYYGQYNGESFTIFKDFLEFEHTDGLNYINLEIRNTKAFIQYKKIKLFRVLGAGGGILLPRTNTSLMNKERYDKFHLCGFGMAGVAGLKLLIGKSFFIQTELKGGYINMPSIRTSYEASDKADQRFFFGQYNIVFGGQISLKKKKSAKQ